MNARADNAAPTIVPTDNLPASMPEKPFIPKEGMES